jgi:hypothetical protein
MGIRAVPLSTGRGALLNLEFLVDGGRRVAAFGYNAGYAGASLVLETWAWQLNHLAGEPLPGVFSYPLRLHRLRTSKRQSRKALPRLAKRRVCW